MHKNKINFIKISIILYSACKSKIKCIDNVTHFKINDKINFYTK